MLERPDRADRPPPARPLLRDGRGHRRPGFDLDREPVRDRGGGDGLVGPGRPGAACDDRRDARRLGRGAPQGGRVGARERGVEAGLAVGLYPSIVELLKTIETHLAEGYRRVKIKIAPGRDVE